MVVLVELVDKIPVRLMRCCYVLRNVWYKFLMGQLARCQDSRTLITCCFFDDLSLHVRSPWLLVESYGIRVPPLTLLCRDLPASWV